MTTIDAIHARREEKDAFFRTSPHSPLSPQQQAQFTGLSYYAPDPELDMVVTVELLDVEAVPVMTTTNEIRHYRPYGRFSFEVDGGTAELTIYETPHGYFLPFVDAGAGSETYGAGRYIDPEQLSEDTFHVDFNDAYNPYCVYSDRYSCPLTPPENRLGVYVRAGEKVPEGAWAAHN
jgi:hypothetical protein